MLKYHTIDVSCRAIPQEVSLIFNITGCTIKCPGCCERALWKDKGIPLTFDELRSILENYNSAVSCVCFMGGEHEPQEINVLARFVKHNYPCLRTAWYSGLDKIAKEVDYTNFNYLKTGAYEASKGALGTPGTNQRVFIVEEDCSLTDITEKYIRTEPDEERVLEVVKEETADGSAEDNAELPENGNEETVAEGTALPAAEEMVTVETDASLADEPVEEQMEDSDESPETKEEIQLPADTKDGVIMEI